MKWKAQTFSSFSSSAFSFFFIFSVLLLLSSSITRHQSLVPKIKSQVFFFFFWNELSITMALAGRHYPFPMWRVGHVATSPPFFWFVIFFFFKLIWFDCFVFFTCDSVISYTAYIGMAMGRGKVEGWGLRPLLGWIFLAPFMSCPAWREKFLTPFPPLRPREPLSHHVKLYFLLIFPTTITIFFK